MQNYVEKFESKQIVDSGKKIPEFGVGDLVEVHNKIVEKTPKGDIKERIQVYKGTIISYTKGGIKSSIAVRKISSGVGVEKVFPIYSPMVVKIVRVTIGKVRQAKLFYLRELSGKKARIESKRVT